MGVSVSTKETTLHYFRDPLIDLLGSDNDLELTGIVVIGVPQDNDGKDFSCNLAASLAQAMRIDGAIVTTEGWGNDHIDFALLIESLSKSGIETAGLSFVGKEGFVVKNRYMDAIADTGKSEDGYETGRVGENTANALDAEKALAFLKLKLNKRGE